MMPLSYRKILSHLLILGLALGAAGCGAAAERSAFAERDLDALMVGAEPAQPGTVELLPLPKIRVEASLAALPAPRKTAYLVQALALFGVHDLPVTEGMVVTSAGGRRLQVYIEHRAALRARADLRPQDAVTLYAYLVYYSQHGPGILVADFEPRLSLGQRLRRRGPALWGAADASAR